MTVYQKNKNKADMKRGVTLVEMVIAMAIMTIVSLAIMRFQNNMYKYKNLFTSGINLVTDGLRITRPMSNEIRSMSPASDGAYSIQTAGTSTLTFFNDLDNDGLKERVRYFKVGTILKRGLIKPTIAPVVYNTASETVSILTKFLQNTNTQPVFQYYDDAYTGNSASSSMTQPVVMMDVRLIKITLILDDSPIVFPRSVTVTSQVTPRNLKDNL